MKTNNANADRVEVTAADGTHWHVQLLQTFDGIQDLQEGATYTVRFRAKAGSTRSVNLNAEIAEPDYHAIGLGEVVPVTKDWGEYSYKFQAKQLAASNQIVFNLGERHGDRVGRRLLAHQGSEISSGCSCQTDTSMDKQR